jgi:hypothetical protein
MQRDGRPAGTVGVIVAIDERWLTGNEVTRVVPIPARTWRGSVGAVRADTPRTPGQQDA